MKPRIAVRVGCLALLAVAGCKKTAATSDASAAPAEALPFESGATRDFAGDEPAELDGLMAEFDRLDADLSAAGVSTDRELQVHAEGADDSERAAMTETSRAKPQSRCERVCDLKAAICDVAERICDLAESHPDEPSYANACTRGQRRCEQATEACDDCA